MDYTIAMFGEAERGEFRTAYFVRTYPAAGWNFLAIRPLTAKACFYAVQALLFKRNIIFFRVVEEGFSTQDYLTGVHLLRQQQLIRQLDAICIPGVGDPQVIDAMQPLCLHYHSILISNEADFYDYLTSTQIYK